MTGAEALYLPQYAELAVYHDLVLNNGQNNTLLCDTYLYSGSLTVSAGTELTLSCDEYGWHAGVIFYGGTLNTAENITIDTSSSHLWSAKTFVVYTDYYASLADAIAALGSDISYRDVKIYELWVADEESFAAALAFTAACPEDEYNEIYVERNLTLQGGEWRIPRNTGVKIEDGRELTVGKGATVYNYGDVELRYHSKLIICGRFVNTDGTIFDASGLENAIEIREGGILEGDISKALNIDVASISELLHALELFETGAYATAWIHLYTPDGEENIFDVTEDIVIPQECGLDINRNTRVVIHSGATMTVLGWINLFDGYIDIEENGKLICLGNINGDIKKYIHGEITWGLPLSIGSNEIRSNTGNRYFIPDTTGWYRISAEVADLADIAMITEEQRESGDWNWITSGGKDFLNLRLESGKKYYFEVWTFNASVPATLNIAVMTPAAEDAITAEVLRNEGNGKVTFEVTLSVTEETALAGCRYGIRFGTDKGSVERRECDLYWDDFFGVAVGETFEYVITKFIPGRTYYYFAGIYGLDGNEICSGEMKSFTANAKADDVPALTYNTAAKLFGGNERPYTFTAGKNGLYSVVIKGESHCSVCDANGMFISGNECFDEAGETVATFALRSGETVYIFAGYHRGEDEFTDIIVTEAQVGELVLGEEVYVPDCGIVKFTAPEEGFYSAVVTDFGNCGFSMLDFDREDDIWRYTGENGFVVYLVEGESRFFRVQYDEAASGRKYILLAKENEKYINATDESSLRSALSYAAAHDESNYSIFVNAPITVTGSEPLVLPVNAELSVYYDLKLQNGVENTFIGDTYVNSGRFSVYSGTTLCLDSASYEDWVPLINLRGGSFGCSGTVKRNGSGYANIISIAALCYDSFGSALDAVRGIAPAAIRIEAGQVESIAVMKSELAMTGAYGSVGIGLLSGNTYEADKNLALPGNTDFIINEGVKFIIPEDVTLTVPGALVFEGGSIINRGNLIVKGAFVSWNAHSFLENNGRAVAYGYFDVGAETENGYERLTVSGNRIDLLQDAEDIMLWDVDGNLLNGKTVWVDLQKRSEFGLGVSCWPEDATIVWTGSNDAVATVNDEGVVSFASTGDVTITAAGIGGRSSASVNFKVCYDIDEADPYSYSFRAVCEPMSVIVGGTAQIKVYGNGGQEIPTDAIAFATESALPCISIGEDGAVTGNSVGSEMVKVCFRGSDPLARCAEVCIPVVAAPAAKIVIKDGEGQVLSGNDLIRADVKAVNQVFSIEPQDAESKLLSTFTFASTDGKVAKVAKDKATGCGVITIPAKASGACSITATSADKKQVYSIRVFVQDYAPRIGADKLTLNCYLEGGVSTALVAGYDNVITDIKVLENSVLSTNLEAEYVDDTVIITPVNGKILINGKTIAAVLNVSTEMGEYQLPVKVSVKNTFPSVTVKQTQKLNTFIKGGEALYTVTAKNAEIENVVLNVAGCTCEYRGDGVLAVKQIGSVSEAKGNLTVSFKGYSTAYTKTGVALAKASVKPTLVLSATTGAINAGEKMSVELDVLDKLTGESILSSCDVKTTTPGFVYDFGTLKYTGAETFSKKVVKTVTLEVTSGKWANPATPIRLTYKLTIQPAAALPVAKLSSAALTLNSLYDEMTASAKFITDQQNKQITEAQFTCDAAKGKIAVVFDADTGDVTARITDSSVAKGAYTFTCTPKCGNTALKAVKLKVNVVNTTAAATVSAKGTLDPTLRASGEIVYTVTLKNIIGTISGVKLIPAVSVDTNTVKDGSGLFNVTLGGVNEKGLQTVLLTLKPDAEYSVKATYKFKFSFAVESAGEVATAAVSVKLKQSALKLTVAPAEQQVFQAQGSAVSAKFTVSVTAPVGAEIGVIRTGSMAAAVRKVFSDAGCSVSWAIAPDGKSAVASVYVKDTTKLVAGKSYTIPVEVAAAGSAADAAITKTSFKLKAAK